MKPKIITATNTPPKRIDRALSHGYARQKRMALRKLAKGFSFLPISWIEKRD